ncbi:hypothetical protein ABW20_dc0107285 [Dactylellina cionopaga]|nr:hypothetical protein ABW20_dc0107285 [Dactylellina cionopaga]
MSAADPRKLLAAARKSRRITSPYASYSLAGALFCTICSNTPIKSDSLWDAHVASAQHKANVARKGGIVSGVVPGKSNKRPAESSIDDDTATGNGNVQQASSSKRLKTARADVKNLALPVGFFDDEDENEDAVVSTGEVIEPDEEQGRPTNTADKPVTVAPANSKLPADFFSSSANPASKPPDNQEDDILDDEWAAFQADIAQAEEEVQAIDPSSIPVPIHTISAPALSAAEIQQKQLESETTDSMNNRNTRTIAEEEMEEARAAMADFFEEQNSLEERVQRLKERREILRQANNARAGQDNTTGAGNMRLGRSDSVRSVTMGGMDDASNTADATAPAEEESEDEDFEDDESMFFRRR